MNNHRKKISSLIFYIQRIRTFENELNTIYDLTDYIDNLVREVMNLIDNDTNQDDGDKIEF